MPHHRDPRRVAQDSDLPREKWLVAFRNPKSRARAEGSVIIRQFLAPGFYEAYDTVMSFAEKSNFEILWFKEKRLCEPYVSRMFPSLESLCTFCNRKFNQTDPIPCAHEECLGEFCSRDCMLEHKILRHRPQEGK